MLTYWRTRAGSPSGRDQTARLHQLEAQAGRDAAKIKQLEATNNSLSLQAHYVQQTPQFTTVSGSVIIESPDSDTPT